MRYFIRAGELVQLVSAFVKHMIAQLVLQAKTEGP